MSRIDEYVIKSFNNVKTLDKDLPNDIHERTFVFRFGYYLQNYLNNDIDYNDYKVDVEYNRKNVSIKELNGEKIMPDLIFHKRRTTDNLVAVEFKKNNNSQKDKDRLIKLQNQYEFNYKNIYFIIINKNKIEKYIDNSWIEIGDIHE